MNTNTSVGKPYPQKPVKTLPVEITKEASQEDALSVLKYFYQEVKREIKLRENTTMKKKTANDCDSISFHCEDFSLVIDFKGGIAV